MSPDDRAKQWEIYVGVHRKASENLRANTTGMNEAQLRSGLALLHDGIADLATQLRDRERGGVIDASHPEYHKVRQVHLYEMAAKRFASAADFARLGVQSALIANGGALVGMLTFLGNTELSFAGGGLWTTFGAFVVGLVAALSAVLLAYRTQSAYGRQEAAGSDKIYFHLLNDFKPRDEQDAEESRQMRLGGNWEIAGVIVYCVSVIAFIVGAAAGVATLATAS
ncbi:MAG: hypothetical protein K2X34_11820 [Hyphomonadaceae bacterium]|nr:hypothetical protein [Hyphomonadaceae bacterium]